MTVTELISYLRLNVMVQDPTLSTDTVYLALTDEEIELYLQVALSRDFPNETLDTLPNDIIYPLMLLAKKEMYSSLAVKYAPDYNLGADNNNYLKRSERFSHFMALVDVANKEYQDYIDNGGAGGYALTSHNVTLAERYYTRYNYEYGLSPALSLYLKDIGTEHVEIFWRATIPSHFKQYEVYISDTPIVDLSNVTNHISVDAQKVATIKDIHQTSCKISGLSDLESKALHIAVSAEMLNKQKAYAQIVVGGDLSE